MAPNWLGLNKVLPVCEIKEPPSPNPADHPPIKPGILPRKTFNGGRSMAYILKMLYEIRTLSDRIYNHRRENMYILQTLWTYGCFNTEGEKDRV